MTLNGGFELVRRQRQHDHFQGRDLIGTLNSALGDVTGQDSSSAAADSTSSAAATSATGVGSSAGSSAGSSNAGSTGTSTTGSKGSSSSAGSGGVAGGSNASAVGSASSMSNAASAATSNKGSTSNAAAATSAAGTSATATAAAVTAAVSTSTSTPAAALTTSLITAANGSVATSVLAIGGNPTANPFGNVALINSSTTAALALSSIVVPPGGYGSSTSSDSGSSSSKNNKIIIPVAVIAGVLALGLLIALMLQKQRNSMERELRKPHMMSNKANLIAATSGALGFTAAGAFLKNRRGSEYNKSSHGHGNYVDDEDDRESWLAGRPISEAIGAGAIQYEDRDSMEYSNEGHHQTVEMSNEEMAAHSSGAILRPDSVYNGADDNVGMAMSSNNYNQGPMDNNSNYSHRQSVITGEGGGYLTASEEGNPMHGSFFNHNNQPRGDIVDEASSQSHYDGSADYGYSNSAVKGLDAAAVQKASGGQMLSPYKDLQRGNDARHSVAGTEISTGQAYDGVDVDEDPFNLSSIDKEARPNPNYDGNRVMQHPQLNSSRWSG